MNRFSYGDLEYSIPISSRGLVEPDIGEPTGKPPGGRSGRYRIRIGTCHAGTASELFTSIIPGWLASTTFGFSSSCFASKNSSFALIELEDWLGSSSFALDWFGSMNTGNVGKGLGLDGRYATGGEALKGGN